MSSDSIINSSIPSVSKDFTKKKRANRSAKLKQCKLDARRQQWLSQVDNKGPKVEGSGNGSGNREFNGQASETKKGKKKGRGPCCKGVEVRSVSVVEVHNHDSDSESSIANSPTGSVNDSGNRYAASSSSSISNSSASSLSFGSGGCCSGSITEDEGVHDGDDGCLDDWEAVADALVGAETNNNEKQSLECYQSLHKETSDDLNSNSGNQQFKDQNVDVRAEKGKSDSVEIPGRGGVNSKAWRSDDTCRPQSLPNLSNQRNLNPWVCRRPPSVPTSCPICCEDFDLTDSSFLPCPCGFHLCLFCHKRILEEDGRCPGCRKPYSSEPIEKETTLAGGSLTIRLARSCSMFSRG